MRAGGRARGAREGQALEAHYAHLLVHGTLHAQGHDHEDEQEAEVMETRESEVMRGLGYPILTCAEAQGAWAAERVARLLNAAFLHRMTGHLDAMKLLQRRALL